MKAEWREPSGESCESPHRAACATPLKLDAVLARAIRCSRYTLQFHLNDERIGRPDVTGSLARLRYKHRAACAAPLKLKAEWREPSGVR